MAYNMNQFGLINQAGETMNVNADTIAARVSKDAAASLVPGDFVSFVAAEVGDAPVIDKAALGAIVAGVVLNNPKQASFAAKAMVEIGLPGTIVTVVAGTSFNRGVDVYYVPTTGYTQGTTGVRVGIALDIASATGDIVRVLVNPKAA